MTPTPGLRSHYGTWATTPVRVGSLRVTIASKPGVFAHGVIDPAAMMLAEWIAERPSCETAGRSLHVASGNGLVAAVARHAGFVVTALDRYAPNVHATRRSVGDGADVRHAAWPEPEDRGYQLATVRIPTDRLSAQLAVSSAYRSLAPGGTLLVAGANDEGIKPLATFLAQQCGTVRLEAQHSGHRLLAVHRTQTDVVVDPTIAPWLDPSCWHDLPVTAAGTTFVCASRPGVFSWQHLDEATRILCDVLHEHPIPEGATVLDLGCGAGVLSVVAARQSRTGRVVLLDADVEAVRSANETLRRAECPNAMALASDVTSDIGDEVFDVVISNPPFHVGKATELDVPRAFIESAHARLVPGGVLRLVANRTLPYERWITECFGAVECLHDGRRFKVLGATLR